MRIIEICESIEEAEKDTDESNEIVKVFKQNGYNQIGSGADATVWAKDAGSVIKILMPDSEDITKAAFTFKKFYTFCKNNESVACLPKFIPIQGKDYQSFQLGTKKYLQISMEELRPIPTLSFDEGIVWFFSDFVIYDRHWDDVNKKLLNSGIWADHNWKQSEQYAEQWKNLNIEKRMEYQILYMTMNLLYKTGKINKLGWDLHTENAMMRGDTIVITDPWFERYSGSL